MSCLRYCASGSSASRKAPERDMSNDSIANILIVDDDVKALMAMEALLAGPGREIVTAKSGAEALRFLLRRDLALIFLDVRIPTWTASKPRLSSASASARDIRRSFLFPQSTLWSRMYSEVSPAERWITYSNRWCPRFCRPRSQFLSICFK